MRILVAAVLVVSIIALTLVSGCTDILFKQKAGGFGQVSPSAGTGGGTGGGNGEGIGGGSGVSPVQGAYSTSPKYSRFQLNYYYRDITKFPRYMHQGCGECDAVSIKEKSDESHNELLIQGVIGGMMSPELYSPHSNLEVSPSLSPRMSFSGKNYRHIYEFGEGYSPSDAEKKGCQGLGASKKTGFERDTVKQGECNDIQVRIAGIDEDELVVYIQEDPDGSECTSDETFVERYKGTSLPDSVRREKRDGEGEYQVVCAPYEKGVVQSDETEDYFFGKGAGEQTTRDFSVDSNGVYHIVCSGSKDEVLEPACTTNCDGRSCWFGSAATRHRERFLEILITPVDNPVTLQPRGTVSLATLAPLEPPATLATLAPLEPLAPLAPLTPLPQKK
jgi:hypothetical protein